MRINNNLMAMNTHRQLGVVSDMGAKATEKLSSGYRINRAGDDAAGLAISEKMRGQIRGLTQASRNAQDGISLIQTAEGALTETHAILQRMRELAVQASNDTNTDVDRGEIQKEIDQLNSEIDRIANTTEFNTKKLINGGANVSAEIEDNLKELITILGGTGDTKVDATLTISGTTMATAATATPTDAVFADGVVSGDNGLNVSINGTEFNFVKDTTIQDVLDAINDAGLGVVASESENKLVLTTNAVGSAAKLVTNIGDVTAGEDAKITMTDGPAYSAQGNVITISEGDAKGLSFRIEDATESNLSSDNTIKVNANGTLSFLIGANEGQSMYVGIGDMRSSALGVAGIRVDDAQIAEAAITTINNAIESVSAERSKLGAYQNRLEHTIKNLDTSAENLQASESRIRDVDMAQEMMEFTKQNILQQASTAMLAQANAAPQSVLQLLQ